MDGFIARIKKSCLFLLIACMVPMCIQAMEIRNRDNFKQVATILRVTAQELRADMEQSRRDIFWLDVKLYTALATVVFAMGYYLRRIYCYERLSYAISKEDFKLIKEYVTKVNLDKPLDGSGRTFLHFAVLHRCNKVVKTLLEYKANPNVLCKHGESMHTPLTLAIMSNKIKKIKILLDYKANPNARDAEGKTPLFCAIQYLYPQYVVAVAQMLLKAGADYRNLDGNRNNILHIAAQKKLRVCDEFLALKRSLEKENEWIRTFLLCMKRKEKQEYRASVVQLFLQYLGIANKPYKLPVPPRAVLLKILNYAGISDTPYKRNAIASTGLLLEKNKEGQTPYDILKEKDASLVEKFRPTELQLKYSGSILEYSAEIKHLNVYSWREQSFKDMLVFSKNNAIHHHIESI